MRAVMLPVICFLFVAASACLELFDSTDPSDPGDAPRQDVEERERASAR